MMRVYSGFLLTTHTDEMASSNGVFPCLLKIFIDYISTQLLYLVPNVFVLRTPWRHLAVIYILQYRHMKK